MIIRFLTILKEIVSRFLFPSNSNFCAFTCVRDKRKHIDIINFFNDSLLLNLTGNKETQKPSTSYAVKSDYFADISDNVYEDQLLSIILC